MTQSELREEIKNAMRGHEEVRLSVLRGLLSACTNELVAKGKRPTDEMSEDDVMALVRRGAKQRRDSIEQFSKGGRNDLVVKEKAELAILEAMLPAQMARDEVEKLAKVKAAELGILNYAASAVGRTESASGETKSANASASQRKNQLMSALMKDLKGLADGTVVKQVVDNLF